MDESTTPDNNPNKETGGIFRQPFIKTSDHAPDDGPYLVETTHQATASALQKAADVADLAANKVEDAAAYAGRKADDAVAYAGQKTGEASAAAGGRLRSLGQTVRDNGPGAGRAGEASSAVADSLDKSGRYLQEEGIKDMAEDITNLIRRNPIPAMLVGIAAGYLAGRAMSPRS